MLSTAILSALFTFAAFLLGTYVGKYQEKAKAYKPGFASAVAMTAANAYPAHDTAFYESQLNTIRDYK